VLAHLLRDIQDLKMVYPQDLVLDPWAQAVHQLYTKAKSPVTTQVGQGLGAQLALEKRLLALCRPFLNDPLAVQGKLCWRIERFIKGLLVFVADPAVPSENNAAERSLRHLVTSRKISGAHSEKGTSSKPALSWSKG
jgi:hypothetical protein